MKLKTTILAAVVATAMALSSQAGAIFLGTIVNGIPPNEANEQAWTQYLINMTPGTTVTSATAIPSLPGDEVLTRNSNVNPGLGDVLNNQIKTETGNHFVGTGFAYVTGKYGNDGTGVWYLDGGSFTLPDKWQDVTGVPSTGGGLSHVTTYGARTTRVPDGGATLALLGAGVAGLGLMRRRK